MVTIKIKKGDIIFCVHRNAVVSGKTPGMPIKGIVLGITAKLNRQIAIELDEEIRNGHTCEGRGKKGYCVWCRPRHILTVDEWKQQKKALEAAAKSAKQLATDVDELTLRK